MFNREKHQVLQKNNHKKRKVLIIDDEIINLELISNIIKSNYIVYKTDNGKEAIKLAITHHPDLILLDIVMPDMDGFETCRQLKKNTATKNIPIIFLTSKNTDKDESEGFKAGAVDYLIKPFREEVDLQRLAVHIKLSRQSNKATKVITQSKERFFGLEKEIKELYELTDAEVNLANGLIHGLTLEEIAKNSGIAYSTLRGYLRNVFLKTKTNKQHELVASIMSKLLSWK